MLFQKKTKYFIQVSRLVAFLIQLKYFWNLLKIFDLHIIFLKHDTVGNRELKIGSFAGGNHWRIVLQVSVGLLNRGLTQILVKTAYLLPLEFLLKLKFPNNSMYNSSFLLFWTVSLIYVHFGIIFKIYCCHCIVCNCNLLLYRVIL